MPFPWGRKTPETQGQRFFIWNMTEFPDVLFFTVNFPGAPPGGGRLARTMAMIQHIDDAKCVGCGVCVQKCPLDTIRLNEQGKAFIAYPDDCMTCFVCERLCPAGAIFVHPFKEKLPPVFPGPRYEAVEGNDLRDKEVYHA